jgi:mannosyl-3-phosphoglycerate phosphatase
LKTERPKPIIFTDIDGTILDEEDSWQETKPFIRNILSQSAVLVFCSSKTRAEIEFYRNELGVADPFISENGGAIFIPKGYFSFAFPCSKHTNKYDVIELGAPYSEVKEKLAKVSSATGVEIIGFRDMTATDVARETGLPLELAISAKNREYDEPFRLICGDEKAMVKAFEAEGLTLTAGSKYFHALGNTDKGKAVTVLKGLFATAFGEIITYGVGDCGNDLSMLTAVDVPQLVRRKFGGSNANLVVWRNLLNMISSSAN